MDKTALENKIILEHIYECCKDTSVYIAIITYTLVTVIRSKLKTPLSTYEMLQIMSASLFDETPLNELLQSPVYMNVKEQKCEQLKFELI